MLTLLTGGVIMKTTASKKIIESFPILEEHVPSNESVILSDQILSKLNEVEQVFLRLIWFFENPEKENFNIEVLYKHLDNEWLEFALECIHTFFLQDTYLIKQPNHSIITDGDCYLTQSRFADYLSENGLKYDRSKLNMYVKRGIAPKADVIIGATNFWHVKTCEAFLKKQLAKQYTTKDTNNYI